MTKRRFTDSGFGVGWGSHKPRPTPRSCIPEALGLPGLFLVLLQNRRSHLVQDADFIGNPILLRQFPLLPENVFQNIRRC